MSLFNIGIAIFDKDGNIKSANSKLKACMDSKIKKLEEDSKNYIQKLKQEESRFIASINSLSVGFIIVDVKNNILIKNQAVDNILGLTELEGNVLLKGDIEEIENKLKGSYDLKIKWENCLKDGKIISEKKIAFGSKFLSFYIAPVSLIETKEKIGAVILIEDVTDAVVMERSKDEFFSIASHELRTPLTAIRGNTSMILDYYKDQVKDPELKQMLLDTHEASVRLIGIVNDFLDMSRLEMSRIEFKLEKVNMADVINETIKEYEVTGSRNKLSIELITPKEELPLVLADRNRVKQVLINLVGNGLKFTTEGGIKIELLQKDGFIETKVIDTGIGIPLANQSLLFRKFQQAGNSTMTRDGAKGTGLGLYISKLMIEGMRGKIYLEKSEVDKGSVFTFTLPVVKL